VTFQRKLLVGFSLMVLPVLLVGAEAIRSNALERRALDALGTNLTRTRTYAEVETAMFNQDEVIWRYLSGLDPDARHEYELSGEVVDYWFDRWRAELRPDEVDLATNVERVQKSIDWVADSVFKLVDAGRRDSGYALARRELKTRLLPILTDLNHEIYRRARQYSVQRAFGRVQEIVDAERRALLGIMILALVAGLVASWLISRSLARPIHDLRRAMAIVGGGDLDHPIHPTGADEVSDLGRAFAQMTASLRQSRADTERLNAQLAQQVKLASIGEMSAAVAHGLRNPLASLRAAAQLALRHPESPAAREQLRAIIEEVDRLDRRISHLLSFSRPAPFHPSLERLPQLVESILPTFTALARERGVTVTTALDPSLPEIRVDPMQLEQAIVEVVSNALDAMPGGGTLTIAAAAEDGGAVLSIADTGAGIPPQVLASVGEPFFTTRPEGTGLGLATARRYVEQNGGRLELTSEPGRGTVVRFHLPPAERAATVGAGGVA
jgi:signal transduction histidine kinase